MLCYRYYSTDLPSMKNTYFVSKIVLDKKTDLYYYR